jgi:hypothetical protein
LAHYPLGEADLIFPNEIGEALRRTLFRSRVWLPSLVRAGLLGSVTATEDGGYSRSGPTRPGSDTGSMWKRRPRR